MAQVFHIDLTSLNTHEERFAILQIFEKSNFDIHENWVQVGDFHRTIDYIEATWFYTTEPKFPVLPDNVKITRK